MGKLESAADAAHVPQAQSQNPEAEPRYTAWTTHGGTARAERTAGDKAVYCVLDASCVSAPAELSAADWTRDTGRATGAVCGDCGNRTEPINDASDRTGMPNAMRDRGRATGYGLYGVIKAVRDTAVGKVVLY